MKRGFEISAMPYIPALHAWTDHLQEDDRECFRCAEVSARLGAGEEIAVSEFCEDGIPIFLAFVKAIDDQHVLALNN